MKLLYNTMQDNEVSEQYANQIIDEIEKANKPNVPFDYVLANVYQKMILKFGKPVKIMPAGKGAKVVFFVGPTGVGKTTTIAKIASKFHVEEGKKIVLFTTDTYRIAAAEQLRTYANIMGVPFKVIYSEDEMKQLFPYALQALENTEKIASRCHVKITFGEYKLPQFDVPQGYTAEAYLEN